MATNEDHIIWLEIKIKRVTTLDFKAKKLVYAKQTNYLDDGNTSDNNNIDGYFDNELKVE